MTANQEKYKLHYDRLVDRARNRILDLFVEVHHILPRCLGGSDDENNLVCFTPEEHFVAHQLLLKIYPNEPKLAYGALMMTTDKYGHRVHNKLYGWIKRKLSENNCFPAGSEAAKQRAKKCGESQKGKKLSDEHKRNLANSMIGKHHSVETKSKMSLAALNRSEETKQRRKEMHSSSEYREKLRVASSKKKWIFYPLTKETKFVNTDQLAEFISIGWQLGRSVKSV